MSNYVTIEEFWELSQRLPIVDVRAPIEFKRAHIPGATNLPLFTDVERAEIGTIYKENGRESSVLRGLELVGPKMRDLASSILEMAIENSILLHCWRGGMRSRSVGWLANQVEIETRILQGGYKAFRKHVINSFKRPIQFCVVSGLTGAGKTRQIQLLQRLGEQIIDLEKIASHRGSAFGGIGLEVQPTVEHFENELFAEISKLDLSRRVWVEDESRMIGSVRLPHHFFAQIRQSPAFFMDVSVETRTELILQEYGGLSPNELVAAIQRITKRLGGQHAKRAIEFLSAGDVKEAVRILLDYYDRLYLSNRERMKRELFVDFAVNDPNSETTTRELIERADSLSVNGSVTRPLVV